MHSKSPCEMILHGLSFSLHASKQLWYIELEEDDEDDRRAMEEEMSIWNCKVSTNNSEFPIDFLDLPFFLAQRRRDEAFSFLWIVKKHFLKTEYSQVQSIER